MGLQELREARVFSRWLERVALARWPQVQGYESLTFVIPYAHGEMIVVRSDSW